MNTKTVAFKTALPHTIPICAGFTFLGLAYGIYMSKMGFSFIYPFLMAITIFAGSMEFITANLLVSAFDPINAFILALMVNARHLFYGLSMLEKYHGTGKKRFFLIFGMCDESFSINCTTPIPKNVDKGWFMFFVTLMNYLYWAIGAALGGILGKFITFSTEGIDFVMTALFVVIFLTQWDSQKNHTPALIGLGASVLALLIFKGDNFIIPSMILILISLTSIRKKLEKEEK